MIRYPDSQQYKHTSILNIAEHLLFLCLFKVSCMFLAQVLSSMPLDFKVLMDRLTFLVHFKWQIRNR